MKKCSRCQIPKGLDEFGKDKSRYDGLNTKCKLCTKELYELNSKEIIRKNLALRAKNSEKYKETRKKRYNTNKEALLKTSKSYYEANRGKLKIYHKYYGRVYNFNRRRIDPLYRLKGNLRTKTKSFLKRTKRNLKTEEILGCNFDHLVKYIGDQFLPWMTWSNYGGNLPSAINQSWDIDHIIPLSSAKTELEMIKLCNYKNLRPYCSYLNRFVKRNKL